MTPPKRESSEVVGFVAWHPGHGANIQTCHYSERGARYNLTRGFVRLPESPEPTPQDLIKRGWRIRPCKILFTDTEPTLEETKDAYFEAGQKYLEKVKEAQNALPHPDDRLTRGGETASCGAHNPELGVQLSPSQPTIDETSYLMGYEVGFKIGFSRNSPSLPWRKPKERPEPDSRIVCYRPSLKRVVIIRMYGDKILPDDTLCWLYADELPLPDWAGKK